VTGRDVESILVFWRQRENRTYSLQFYGKMQDYIRTPKLRCGLRVADEERMTRLRQRTASRR
jgi:hypothetical protein